MFLMKLGKTKIKYSMTISMHQLKYDYPLPKGQSFRIDVVR